MRWIRLLFWFGKLPLSKPKLASRGPRMRTMMRWFASRSLLWARGPLRGGAGRRPDLLDSIQTCLRT